MATALLYDKPPIKTGLIKKVKYGTALIDHKASCVDIQEILPFRIRLTSITVPTVSPSNVPAIPLQVIGFSNYIL